MLLRWRLLLRRLHVLVGIRCMYARSVSVGWGGTSKIARPSVSHAERVRMGQIECACAGLGPIARGAVSRAPLCGRIMERRARECGGSGGCPCWAFPGGIGIGIGAIGMGTAPGAPGSGIGGGPGAKPFCSAPGIGTSGGCMNING